jgi:hypothetical protein
LIAHLFNFLKFSIFNFYFCKVQIPMANWILFLCFIFWVLWCCK